MKRSRYHLLFCLSVAALHFLAFAAERHCPGNVASVTPRVVDHTLLVIPAKINQQGPFDFGVDTGSQVSVLDPALGAELALKPLATVGMFTPTAYTDATVAVLSSVEAAFQTVEHPLALVHDLGSVRVADPRVRGVLGEDFLSHFDMLIDYHHELVCLDASGKLAALVRGERLPLVGPREAENGLPFAMRLVLAVELSGVGSRPLLLQLDSASNRALLYQTRGKSRLALLDQATPGVGAGGPQRTFADMPPQVLRIGAHTMNRISFVTPAGAPSEVTDREEDGLLPTRLFDGVFIGAAGHYVVLNPRFTR